MKPTIELLVELCFSFNNDSLEHAYFRIVIQLYVNEVIHSSVSDKSAKEILDEEDFEGLHQNDIFAKLYATDHPIRNIATLTDTIHYGKNGAIIPLSQERINQILQS